jgi:hypothetical protein
VWGIRDVIGTIDNQLLRFESGMTLPRDRDDRLASKKFAEYYPVARDSADKWPDVIEGNCVCALRPLPPTPSQPESQPRKKATTLAATTELLQNGDAIHPESIFKDWVFPKELFVRLGIGDDGANGLTISGGLVIGAGRFFDMVTLGRWSPLIPGRVAYGEISVSRTASQIDCHGILAGIPVRCEVKKRAWRQSRGTLLRYERLVTNLFGFYSGVNIESDGARVEPPFDTVRRGLGLSYSVGQMFEWPDSWPLHTNTNVQVGVTLQNGRTPRLDVKVFVGLLKVVSSRFGIDRNSAAMF